MMRPLLAPSTRAARHVFVLFRLQHRAAYQSGVVGYVGQADCQHHLDETRPKRADDAQRQQNAGNGQEDVHDSLDQIVDPAA